MPIYSWTCPHCNQPTTITDNDVMSGQTDQFRKSNDGSQILITKFTICPNTDCKKITLEAQLYERITDNLGNKKLGQLIKEWQLIPDTNAKSFPEYVPKQIIMDYCEACLIRNNSPKASATLSRRCLQGIIRDFWGVKSGRLIDEIEQIKDKVDPLVWEAIDSVRKIGNIGAHMEKDINLIIDVEPEEAGLLIGLIEMLLTEWYIAREERKKRLQDIINLSTVKQESRK